MSVLGEMIYTDTQRIGSDFSYEFTPLDAYTAINAAFTYEIQGWRNRGRLDNVIDEFYEASTAMSHDERFDHQAAFFAPPSRALR